MHTRFGNLRASTYSNLNPSEELVDETSQTSDPSINTREPRKRTSSTPADSTNHGSRVHINDRATAVTLAGVFATCIKRSADHVFSDSLRWAVRQVVGNAIVSADDWYINLAQD